MKRATKKPAVAKRPAKPAVHKPPYFMVDGKFPRDSFDDATFLADLLADERGESVEIRRLVEFQDVPSVYVRQPRHREIDREQPIAKSEYIIVDGLRVVYRADSFQTAMAFHHGYRGGVMCAVYGQLSDEERKEKGQQEVRSLELQAQFKGFKLVKLPRSEAE